MTARSMVMAAVLLVAAAAVPRAQGTAPIPENYYAAGERVELPAPVDGDAVLAGRLVTVTQSVSGDVLAAGWRVRIAAAAADDVRAAGAEVQVEAPVHGDLTAAAGDLTVASSAQVGGRAWLTGRTVRADGTFAREVRIAAEQVLIGGEVRAPMRVVAQRLDILPGARVLAPLTYEGATPANVAPGATLAQPIAYRRIAASEARQARWPRGLSSVVFGIHVFFGGLLLLLVAPRLVGRPAAVLREQPGRSLLAGLALLVTVPFVALLLMITLVGLPAGLALGAAYAAALFIGVVTTAVFIGELEQRLLGRTPLAARGRRAVVLLAGVVTLALLRSVPVLGTLVVFAAIVLGLGAMGLWLTAQRPAPTAT